jgi:hypothetical protein
MFVYIGIVLVGYWYIWKKGALDWGLTITQSPRAQASRAGISGPATPQGDPELLAMGGSKR